MTPGGDGKPTQVNQRNLLKAIQIAERCGITNVLITGKGEPTLVPGHIDDYMLALRNKFPFIELQTNGGFLFRDTMPGRRQVDEMLCQWYDSGMTTIMISNVGHDPDLNQRIYWPDNHEKESPFDPTIAIKRAHDHGFVVRYTTIGVKGGVDSVAAFEQLVDFCLENGVEQLTWRPATATWDETSQDLSVNRWIEHNGVPNSAAVDIKHHVQDNATQLYSLAHGAAVFDYRGQNVCLSNCLTIDPETDVIRQLIFFPDGKLFTDWQFEGSRLL
jgi:MoaA/NifB/PqqE/SkfB family radical SAM enzyme